MKDVVVEVREIRGKRALCLNATDNIWEVKPNMDLKEKKETLRKHLREAPGRGGKRQRVELTPEEIKKESLYAIALKHKTSVLNVLNILYDRKMMSVDPSPPKTWTKEDTSNLIHMVYDTPLEEMCRRLKKTPLSIRCELDKIIRKKYYYKPKKKHTTTTTSTQYEEDEAMKVVDLLKEYRSLSPEAQTYFKSKIGTK